MKVGLLLSGGFGKGAYQVGALKAVARHIDFNRIQCISTTSIGCYNAYAYAAGNVAYAEQAWTGINATQENVLLTDLFKNGYLDKVADDLGDMVSSVDFYVSVLKMGQKNRNVDYINLHEIDDPDLRRDYLRASIAVPLLSRSVKINGVRLFDGGCVDNNPITPLRNEDLDVILFLCFDQTVQFADDHLKNKLVCICFDDGTRIKKEMCFTSQSVQSMIAYGEEYAEAILDYVFHKGENDLSEVQKRIEALNLLQADKRNKKQITVAHSLTELNKITQKCVKKPPKSKR